MRKSRWQHGTLGFEDAFSPLFLIYCSFDSFRIFRQSFCGKFQIVYGVWTPAFRMHGYRLLLILILIHPSDLSNLPNPPIHQTHRIHPIYSVHWFIRSIEPIGSIRSFPSSPFWSIWSIMVLIAADRRDLTEGSLPRFQNYHPAQYP